MKTVGKTVVIRNGKSKIEEWPAKHTDNKGNTVVFKKAPGTVIVGDVIVNGPMVFKVGGKKNKKRG